MPGHTKTRFLLLYGSQTGQAKAIAEEISEKADKEGLHAEIYCLSHTEKKFNIEKERCVVIVTSTTGDGEPPDTASKFVRRLKKKTLSSDHLSKLNYALLGLGDSNYTNFCNCGKAFDRRLEDLGAKRLYASGFADDAVGLEVVVEPWMDGLFPALRQFLDLPVPVDSDNNIETTPAPQSITTNSVNLTQVLDTSNMSDYNRTKLCDSDMKALEDGVQTLSCNGESQGKLSNSQNESDGPQNQQADTNKNTTIRSNESHTSNGTDQSSSLKDSTDSPVICNPIIDKSNEDKSVGSPKTDKSNENKSVGTKIVDKSNEDNSVGTPIIVKSDEDKPIGVSSQSTFESKVEVAPSLCASVPPLCDSGLTVPALPPPFLACRYLPEETVNSSELPIQNGCTFPSAAGKITFVDIKEAKILTREDAAKTTMLLSLDTKDSGLQYEAGDSVSVICPNNSQEVNMLLDRLGLSDKGDTVMELSVIPGTKKKNAAVPPHIPPRSSLRHILLTCLDIRDQPKKALLRSLVEHTSDEGEKRRLQELCSKQGGGDYSAYIREAHLSLLDVLNAFPSCIPPIERVIEHLPRLQPRPYSVCSCPVACPDKLDIAFNLMEIPEGNGRSYSRRGVCTGWLHSITGMGKLEEAVKIPIFARTNQHFRCPEDPSVPMIMIGPGTGVAPFIGFLQQRALQRNKMENKETYGQTWLFYGCRHQDRDFLFRKELEEFKQSGVLTELLVSFSRDEQPENSPRYVQDNLRLQGETILDLIETHGARVYVCGDAKNMAKDVTNTFISLLGTYRGLSERDASGYMMKMRLHKTYFEDVWT